MSANMLIALSALAAAGFIVWSRWFEWSHAFRPSRTMSGTPADRGLEYDEVDFVAEDGCRLHGWWIPYPGAAGTLLYCHGNAQNISDRVDLAADLQGQGVNVFIFDYRGYGRSRGRPSEKGIYRDARAAYEVVRSKYADDDKPPVVAYGASLGGAVAVQLALDKPLRGLILECTFPSSLILGRRWYPRLPVGRLLRYRFDSLAKIGSVSIPKLFSHSIDDKLIPFDLGMMLYRAAPEPKSFVSLRGDHDESSWSETPAYLTEIRTFLHRHLGPPAEGLPEPTNHTP